jgi:hypothetical protein
VNSKTPSVFGFENAKGSVSHLGVAAQEYLGGEWSRKIEGAREYNADA